MRGLDAWLALGAVRRLVLGCVCGLWAGVMLGGLSGFERELDVLFDGLGIELWWFVNLRV